MDECYYMYVTETGCEVWVDRSHVAFSVLRRLDLSICNLVFYMTLYFIFDCRGRGGRAAYHARHFTDTGLEVQCKIFGKCRVCSLCSLLRMRIVNRPRWPSGSVRVIDPNFVGSYPGEGNGFVRPIKIRTLRLL
jgi:hypothetical protein